MKFTHLLLIVLIITSCNSVKYVHSGDVNSGLNLKKGKWLLNDVTSVKNDKEYDLTKLANEQFYELLENRLSLVSETKGILIPNSIPYDVDKSILRDIKNGTGYDYFINIKTKRIADEVDVFGGSNNVMSSSENIGEITLTIYDLNILEEIYNQTVVGKLFVPENQESFRISKSSNDIIRSGLKRILKKIKKNQIID